MTFDVEVAENNDNHNQNQEQEERVVDSGRLTISELGGLDSRRSLSEIQNEGDLDNVKGDDDQLTINSKVQSRQ